MSITAGDDIHHARWKCAEGVARRGAGDERDDEGHTERCAQLTHRLVDGRAEGVAVRWQALNLALDSWGRVRATPSPVNSHAGSIDVA